MKVYLVYYDDEDSNTLEGVFSTREKAEEWIAGYTLNTGLDDKAVLYIDERTVDAPRG